MSESDDRRAGLLAAADHLERWAESLPLWSADCPEPWHEFLERRYRMESTIIERLRSAPGCRIKVCPARIYVEMNLAGISVSTRQGLATGLREWARLVRARLEI